MSGAFETKLECVNAISHIDAADVPAQLPSSFEIQYQVRTGYCIYVHTIRTTSGLI